MSVFSEEQIQQLAHELNQSEKSRVQIEHFSKRYPGMTIEDGYRINRAWMQIKFADGWQVSVRVIGQPLGGLAILRIRGFDSVIGC